jgi:hypothetical protein
MEIPFLDHVFDGSDASNASILPFVPYLFPHVAEADIDLRIQPLAQGTTNSVRTEPLSFPPSASLSF